MTIIVFSNFLTRFCRTLIECLIETKVGFNYFCNAMMEMVQNVVKRGSTLGQAMNLINGHFYIVII